MAHEDWLDIVFDYSEGEAVKSWLFVSTKYHHKAKARQREMLLAHRLSHHQRKSMCKLNNQYMNIEAVAFRRCAICSNKWQGSIHSVWGVPAHPSCIRPYLLNVYYLRDTHDVDHVLSSVPHEVLWGYGRFGRYAYLAVWQRRHPCIPTRWTLQWYNRTFM